VACGNSASWRKRQRPRSLGKGTCSCDSRRSRGTSNWGPECSRELKGYIMQPQSGLSIDTVREYWSKTYNTRGKPDWSHIFPFYAEDVVFQDSIQRVYGKKAFVGVCKRLTKRCQELKMDILSVAQNQNTILMEWKMTMVFKKSPSTPLYGCTRLTLDGNGMIRFQRDYYDLWGDIINNIPGVRTLYRRALHRFFG
jgi:hypothetical protein